MNTREELALKANQPNLLYKEKAIINQSIIIPKSSKFPHPISFTTITITINNNKKPQSPKEINLNVIHTNTNFKPHTHACMHALV